MKAFIVEIAVPETWTKNDILTACNVGIKQRAQEQNYPLRAMDYASIVISELQLRRDDI